ncbi:hypothetical protein VA596_37220 [Amycolatopsis sp., V23-08]|uniref:Uncharacterized protein n=1 Tax=Amycolatopsis heterodermiae TaxID=3110235 RepID=A0ABU5RG26_9PSEU|nr:hypothetical protein [Amycolatopsis sp., V23-08]MEA5365222.1 hypothetical protein [Amycolatopsis sp., V23-08]
MTAPAPSDCAWLRSNPASIPAGTPSSFAKLLAAGDGWHQLYQEWLVGTTNGAPNAARVDTAQIGVDELVRWFAQLVAAGDGAQSDAVPAVELSKLSRGEQAIAKVLKQAPSNKDKFECFQRGYSDGFVADITAVRAALKARVEQLRATKDANGHALSAKEAKALAGKETQRLTLANAARTQVDGKEAGLDVNVGLLVQVQIEKYQSGTLLLVDKALQELQETKWDDEEGKFKDKAIKDLGAATTVVLTASAALKVFSRDVVKMSPEDRAKPETEAALFDLMIAFTEAVGKQGRAMTSAGEQVAAWARWATKTLLKENFNTIYPKLGGALLLLRTGVSVAQVTLDFFPPFNAIGTALGVADQALEFGLTELVVWRDKQSLGIQQQYAGQEFVTPWEELSVAAKAVSGFSEGKQLLWDNLKKYTEDLPAEAVKKVASMSVDGLAKVTDISPERQYQLKAGADGVIGALNSNKEKILSLGGVEATLTVTGVIAKAAGDAAGPLGAVLALAETGMDVIDFLADQNKVARNKAGFTDEDVAAIRRLMADKEHNPYHTAFTSGELQLDPKTDPGFITGTVAGTRIKITLGANPGVVNADPAMLLGRLRGFTVDSVGEELVHDGRVFLPDWSRLQLTADQHPKYHLSVPVRFMMGRIAHPGTAELTYDMQGMFSTVTKVTGEFPADPIQAKLANAQDALANGTAADVMAVITDDDLAAKFTAGTPVTADGEKYTISGGITGTERDTAAGLIRFRVAGRSADRRPHELTLQFRVDGRLEVLEAVPEPDPLETLAADAGAVLSTDSLENRLSGLTLGFTAGGATGQYTLDAVKGAVRKNGGIELVMTAIAGSSAKATVTVFCLPGDAPEVTAADPSPAEERKAANRARFVAGSARKVDLTALSH